MWCGGGGGGPCQKWGRRDWLAIGGGLLLDEDGGDHLQLLFIGDVCVGSPISGGGGFDHISRVSLLGPRKWGGGCIRSPRSVMCGGGIWGSQSRMWGGMGQSRMLGGMGSHVRGDGQSRMRGGDGPVSHVTGDGLVSRKAMLWPSVRWWSISVINREKWSGFFHQFCTDYKDTAYRSRDNRVHYQQHLLTKCVVH